MLEAAKLSTAGRILQNESEERVIQFRDGDFYLGREEVTGQDFIMDLEHLRFSSVVRADSKIVGVVPRDSLWDLLARTDDVPTFWARVDVESQNAKNRLIITVALEERKSGVLINFLADTPESRAAIGALCNACARHRLDRSPLVKLVSWKHVDASGAVLRWPKFEILNWEYPSCADDEIPF